MVVTQPIVLKSDNLVIGIDDEATKNGGAGTYGTALGAVSGIYARNALMTLTPVMDKTLLWDLSGGRDPETAENLEGQVIDFLLNYYVIDDPSTAMAEFSSALGSDPDATTGVITNNNFLGSRTYYLGEKISGGTGTFFNLNGAITNEMELTMTVKDGMKFNIAGTGIYNATYWNHAVDTGSLASLNVTAIKAKDIAKWSSLTANILTADPVLAETARMKSFSLKIANTLDVDSGMTLGASNTMSVQPVVGNRLISGTFESYVIPDSLNVRSLATANPRSDAGTGFLTSIAFTMSKNTNAEYFSVTISNVIVEPFAVDFDGTSAEPKTQQWTWKTTGSSGIAVDVKYNA